MHRFRSQRMGSEAGFSLVELLVVAVIVMILSLFAVPIYNALTDKARLANSLEDLRVIEEALEAYQAKNGHYPNRLGSLTKYGYLPKTFTFRSPWSNEHKTRFYFYTVNDGATPSAFLLGDPGPQSECNQSKPAKLHASPRELLPCGTNPNDPARIFTVSEEVELNPSPGTPPNSLSAFRQRCDPRAERDMQVAPGCTVKTES